MKKISIKDIAKELNVSVSTVSLVLNGKGDEKRISRITQERIIKCAHEKNYKANVFAKGLKKGRSEMLGLIIPNISDFFYAKIASRIEKQAARHGYTVIYSSTEESPEKESELIHSMLDRQVEGLMIASSQRNSLDIKNLIKMKFPFVLFDRHYPELNTDYVIVDNKGGVIHAVNHLVEQGSKNIGFVTLHSEIEVLKQRFYGYRDGLEENGLNCYSSYIQHVENADYQRQVKLAIHRLLESPNRVDSIVFSTHYLAVCGLRELRARNIKIPDEIKLVSFDQYNTFDLIEPSLTAVTQPIAEIGDHAVNILLGKLNATANGITKIILDTGFIARKSSTS